MINYNNTYKASNQDLALRKFLMKVAIISVISMITG